jgi:thiamine pyrophosphate-dependent acetolactate synthase large subunit-like protein
MTTLDDNNGQHGIPPARAMPLADAMRVLSEARADAAVITAMGAAREWIQLSDNPLDLVYVPSSMGQAPALGLGLALAQPSRRFIVVNGDGCTLMNLGCLATITAQSPDNFVLVIIDNGVYEVTGSQPTAASAAGRRSGAHLDYTTLAWATGFPSVHRFRDLEIWEQSAEQALSEPGPVFISLDCQPVRSNFSITSPGPMRDRLSRFRQALGVAPS